ncbi:MAG: cell division protein FtsH [Planctomycetaceae bacterium]|nr:cell division protein FtsH [Planctomycetaceae bacterium]
MAEQPPPESGQDSLPPVADGDREAPSAEPGIDRSKPPGLGRGDSDREGAPVRRMALGGPWLLILFVVMLMLFWSWQSSPSNHGVTIDYSQFCKELDASNIKAAHFFGEILTGEFRQPPASGTEIQASYAKGTELRFNTIVPSLGVRDASLLDELRRQEPAVKVTAERTSVSVGTQLAMWLVIPAVFVFGFWLLMRRNSDPMSGGGMIGNFAKSPARRFEPSGQVTSFDDVAAMEQAKAELQEVVEFLKNPERFRKLGAEIPKGVLLKGPPGTGKTLLSRATAGEAGVPFFSINGSEFIQMFVGVGASRVRDLFATARDHAPCILFIDEIDAVGRVRGAGFGGGHDEREQTLNQILSEMDGFDQTDAVIVLGATNRADVLDAALLRPGRFDRHITVDRPVRAGREAILKVHCRRVPLSDDVDLEEIAGATVGFSGAALKNLVNEAALSAARGERARVMQEDFTYAHDRVLMGPRREEVLNEHDRRRTAYHEAGHALLAWQLPEVDPVHKVTIIPRGAALGLTQLLPEEELHHFGESRLHSQLIMLLGGRTAEKLVFDEFGAGAEDDLLRATGLARRMVAHWGMSDRVGPVAFRVSSDEPFLGKEYHEQREFSEETSHVIDQEVHLFLENASRRAFELLQESRELLDRLTEALVDREELNGKDLAELLGPPIVAPDQAASSNPPDG